MPRGTSVGRVGALEARTDETDAVVETLTDKVNDVRLGNARILKNLGALMNAQGVPMVELSEDEADELFD
jgi:hypothetical protein